MSWLLAAQPGPTVTYVRHAETVANATGKYNAKTLNTFSAKGKAQVQALTKRLLKAGKFDEILVSPAPRTLQTIAPYLAATGQRARIWPLLYECCTGRRPKGAHPTKFAMGPRIEVPTAYRDLFILNVGEDRYPVSADYNAGLAQVRASVNQFGKTYTNERVLIVGHSGHGGQFIFALTGMRRHVENAKEILVRPTKP